MVRRPKKLGSKEMPTQKKNYLFYLEWVKKRQRSDKSISIKLLKILNKFYI